MTKFRKALIRWLTAGPFQRWPWLLPLISFAAGWLGFFLIERGEALAQTVAVMALIGWPWLLAENILGERLATWSQGRIAPGALAFVTQNLQQEILFFALPFLIGATQSDPGQIAFTALVAVAAFVSTLDPVYHRRIAQHPGASVAFQGLCTFVGSLVVLPIAAGMPLELAVPVALVISGAGILLGLPRMLAGQRDLRGRAIGLLALLLSLVLLWEFRSQLPPAGLSARTSRITQSLNDLQPGPAARRIDADSLLANGVIAFVAIRAPAGLAQTVTFEWWHRGERLDQVEMEITGGREAGWRAYSRKEKFPADPRGRWRVDVRTPQGQLVRRLRFVVGPAENRMSWVPPEPT